MYRWREKIKELFAAILQITTEKISNATSPKEVAEWDSLKHIIMVSGFEEEFGIDVDQKRQWICTRTSRPLKR